MKMKKDKAIAKLRKLVESRFPEVTSDRFGEWREKCRTVLQHIFGPKSPEYEKFYRLIMKPFCGQGNPSPDDYLQFCIKQSEKASEYLEEKISEIEEYWDDEAIQTRHSLRFWYFVAATVAAGVILLFAQDIYNYVKTWF